MPSDNRVSAIGLGIPVALLLFFFLNHKDRQARAAKKATERGASWPALCRLPSWRWFQDQPSKVSLAGTTIRSGWCFSPLAFLLTFCRRTRRRQYGLALW